MGVGITGFPLKKPPDSYTGTEEHWRSLSQSQRRRIRKGPAIREKERAYRNRPDIKADIKEYRLRPEVKAAAYATYVRGKDRKRAIRVAQKTMHETAVDAIVVCDSLSLVSDSPDGVDGADGATVTEVVTVATVATVATVIPETVEVVQATLVFGEVYM